MSGFSLKDALYHAVHDYEPGTVALAQRMGMAQSSLLNMANPNSAEPGWPMKRFRQVVAITGDVRPVQALCEEAGGVFVPLPRAEVGEDELMLGVARAGKEFGDVCATMTNALRDHRVTPKELGDFHREVMENIRVLFELDQLMQRRAESQPLFKRPE